MKWIRAGLVVAFCLGAGSAIALELVSNGSFEAHGGAGTHVFTGWTFNSQTPALPGGFYPQSGTVGPLKSFVVPPPPAGSTAAMSDQTGPGGYALYQDVALPANTPVVITAQVFVLNQAELYSVPTTLDYASVPNQQARIDIVNPAASLLDVGAGVWLNVFSTHPASARTTGYFSVMANLTPYAGQTVRLRIAETDNQQGLLFGVDAVSIATVSAPSAPAITEIRSGRDSLRVYFTSPVSDGGAPITAYVVTCTGREGSYQGSGSVSPITVSGLNRGSAYSCTVRADNIAVQGSNSAIVTQTVTAISIVPILSIILD